MRKTILIALATLLLSSPFGLHAAGWIEQDSGTIQGYRGITYSRGNLIAVGNGGNIVYSSDSGDSWNLAERNTSTWWYDVTRDGTGNAVAVGASGIYATSSDGGVTWSSVTLSTSANYFDIDLSDSHGYIVGSSGTLLYRSGSVWSTGSTGVTEDLYAVQDLEDGTGWAGGASGRLIKIVSGGVSYANLGFVASDAIRGLYFTTSGAGWIVGDHGMFKKTTDNGVSWTNVSVSGLSSQYLYDIQATGDHMVVAGDKIVLLSDDGGLTWEAESFADENMTFYSAYYGSVSELWLAGTNFDVWSSVYRYDGTGPSEPEELSIGIEAPTTTDTLMLSWNPSTDVESDVGGYFVSVDGSDYEDIGLVSSFELGTFEAGEHSVSVYAADLYENIGSAAELVFTVVDSGEEETVVSEIEPSNLIKLMCEPENTDVNDPCRAVYYYADDGYRHAFPNEGVYFTWFENFDDVVEVTSDFMSSLRLGANVTYHPGTKMVKFQSVPTVYAVSAGGVLHVIASEQVAIDLYGQTWNQQIDDIPDAFFGNYSFGDDINEAADYDVDAAITSTDTLSDNF